MILNLGEKVYIVNRRCFDGDLRRHFVGRIDACTDTCVRVTGSVFVVNLLNKFEKKPESYTRIFSLMDGRIIFNLLPTLFDLEQAQYILKSNKLYLTDGQQFQLDVDEFRSE